MSRTPYGGSQLRNRGFSTVLLGHGVVFSRDGKSTWVIRCIPKSSCHRHPCVLFSHFKSCLAEKIPKKNSAHPRPSQSGASGRNNGLSFPSKKYIFCYLSLKLTHAHALNLPYKPNSAHSEPRSFIRSCPSSPILTQCGLQVKMPIHPS